VVRKCKGPRQKPKLKWEDINTCVWVRACAYAHAHSHYHSIFEYTVNISYNELAEVEGIRLINQDKNVKV
jgi:hypothetical protein